MTPERLEFLRHHAERCGHVLPKDVLELVKRVEELEKALDDAALDLGECGMVGLRDKHRDVVLPPNNPFAALSPFPSYEGTPPVNARRRCPACGEAWVTEDGT